MWRAISNINWMARSMDWNQKVTQQGIESSARQSQKQFENTLVQLKSQTSTEQSTLEVTDRPWLKATSVDFGDQNSKEGVSIVWPSWKGGAGPPLMSLSALHTQNVGKSPATSIHVSGEVFFIRREGGSIVPGHSIREEEDRFCSLQNAVEYRSILFAGDSRQDQIGSGWSTVPLDAIDPEVRNIATIPDQTELPIGGRVLPALIGCISYRYINSSLPHQTRFVFWVNQIGQGGGAGIPIFKNLLPRQIGAAHAFEFDYAY
jgi:hypothetical protein